MRSEWVLLSGSLLVMAALYNHYLGHSSYFTEIVLVAVGASLAVFSLRRMSAAKPEKRDGLLVDFLSRFLSRERIATLLPIVGFAVILVWSAWKIFVTGQADLRMEDFIVTLFGLSLVLYYVGPSEYTMQKDFIVFYLMFLTIVFAVIWKSYSLITGESYSRITAYSEWYFITIPVVGLLRLFGLEVEAELDLGGIGLSNTIAYEYNDVLLRIGIGSGCSGLYSAGLFFSAFLAFVIVRYHRINWRTLTALGLGLAVTWFANIFRMAITIWVGSMYGHPALAFVHSTIGILIFVAFITVFWFLIVRWLDKSPTEPLPTAQTDSAPTTK